MHVIKMLGVLHMYFHHVDRHPWIVGNKLALTFNSDLVVQFSRCSRGLLSSLNCWWQLEYEYIELKPSQMSVSKSSLEPTPLKLSDEMQIPKTVFPASVEVLPNGKTRIRSQYVHPFLNPVENASLVEGAIMKIST